MLHNNDTQLFTSETLRGATSLIVGVLFYADSAEDVMKIVVRSEPIPSYSS